MNAPVMPVLSRAQAAATRQDCAPLAIIPLDDATRLRLTRSRPETHEDVVPADVRVTLDVGSEPLHVFVPRALIEARIRELNDTLSSDSLPNDLTALLLETAMRDDLDRLEAICGHSATVVALARGVTADDAAYRMVAEHLGHHWAVDVDAAGCRPVATAMRRWPAEPRSLSRLPLPAVVRLGTTWLSRRDVASLRSGDVVLLQFTEAAGARLIVLDVLLAAAREEEDGWVLTEPPRRASDPDGREWTMQNDTDAASSERRVNDMDDLPLQLTFDLGTVTMTLGELRNLGAGAVIQLNRDLKELVRIGAHGALVGQGELVEVDGHMGVRIVRLFDHD